MTVTIQVWWLVPVVWALIFAPAAALSEKVPFVDALIAILIVAGLMVLTGLLAQYVGGSK